MMEASGGSFRLAVAGSPMVNGDLVAVPVRFSGNRTGATMDMAGIDLLTVRDGKIVEVQSPAPPPTRNFPYPTRPLERQP